MTSAVSLTNGVQARSYARAAREPLIARDRELTARAGRPPRRLAQAMIGQDEREHRLDDRHRAREHARIVAAARFRSDISATRSGIVDREPAVGGRARDLAAGPGGGPGGGPLVDEHHQRA